MRALRRSLRARLLLLLAALLAVAATGIGTVSVIAINNSLRHNLDQQLTGAPGIPRDDRGGRAGDDVGPADPPTCATFGSTVGRYGALGAQRPDTITACIAGTTVTAFLSPASQQSRSLSASASAVLLSVPTDGTVVTRHVPGLGDYRFQARTARAGQVFVTGLPLAEVTSQVWQLGREIALIAGAALLLALALAWELLRRALAPLQRVAATAARVSDLPLERGEVALSELVAPRDADPRTEIGQVGAALNRLLSSVGNALNARHASETRVRQFVADASHELRTPLAAIRGYAELTRRGREALPPDSAYAMSRVESEAGRMTALVEDLLLLARLDSGRPLASEPVDLSSLVIDAVSDAHAVSQDHSWLLDLPDEPATVTGDAQRLHQVLANLLGNARTHTPGGTRVWTELRRERSELVLRVRDDGPGIPAELVGTVFERFARGDSSRSRAAGSTGLGLAIVEAIVAAHAGSVQVESRPGATAFTVRLPLAAAALPVALST